MNARSGTFAVAAILLVLPGCTCPWGSCTTSNGSADRPATETTADSARPSEPAPTAVGRNASDAEIRVEEIEIREGKGYLIRGTVLSAAPAGGLASIAEAGQSITLTPYFPGGNPDLSSPGQRRLMELSGTPRGATIRCRIALDSRGAWRIISAR